MKHTLVASKPKAKRNKGREKIRKQISLQIKLSKAKRKQWDDKSNYYDSMGYLPPGDER